MVLPDPYLIDRMETMARFPTTIGDAIEILEMLLASLAVIGVLWGLSALIAFGAFSVLENPDHSAVSNMIITGILSAIATAFFVSPYVLWQILTEE